MTHVVGLVIAYRCINEDVKRLGSVASMNDKCLSLKDKSRTSKAAKKKQKGKEDGEEEEEGGCGKSKSSKAKKKRGTTTATKGCPFLDGDGLRELRDVALVSVISNAPPFTRYLAPSPGTVLCVWQSQVRDVEELASLGQDMGVCPYYGARKAVGLAEVSVECCWSSVAIG